MSQNKYMEKALQLANKAKKINEIPVGSVVVDSKGEIIARLQGHQLIRDCSYLLDSQSTSNIRQVDEHEVIFESNYENWHVLEHTRLIDQDKFRSRNIYSWFKDKLKIVENHHEIRIKNPN